MLAKLWAKLGLTGLAIAILCALLTVQTVRLEGFKLWPLSIEGANPRAERLQATLDEIERAQNAAAEKARLARLEQERKYRELADNADEREREIREDAMADAERFIAANRVRPVNRGPVSGTGASPGSGGAEGGERSDPAAELDEGSVIVPAEDVRICTENTSRLLAVREWTRGL